MQSAFTTSFSVLAALAVLLLGAPVFAQSQPPASGDPFSDVLAVDSEQMSAVSGEPGGGIGSGLPQRTGTGTGDCGAGSQCAGGLQGTAVGTTAKDVSASGNTVRISVTAINNQTTITSGGINTGGGLNAAGGGN